MTEQPVTYQQVTVSEAAGDTDATARAQPVPDVSRTNATAPELMAAWSETFLAPIMARMAEQETVIRELERENGRLQAENEALRASQRPQEARETAGASGAGNRPATPDEPVSVPWWRRWLSVAYR